MQPLRLDRLQRDTFGYFEHEANPANGLVRDSTKKDTFASIAAVGFALTGYVVAAQRGFVTRADAVSRTLATLRFFWQSEQSSSPDATGHRGFYYHFLDMNSGRRAVGSELSTIDSAILFAGCLAAAACFDADSADERELRSLAERLYARADWHWALNGGKLVSHGWTPERGFIRHRWDGYSEALILYVLGLGSPDFPLPAESYAAWTESYRWRRFYGIEYLHAGPLFIHQLSHVWLDFRGIQDEAMRGRGSDYFENSRRATYVQRAYAIRNTRGLAGYGECSWGITASDGPGPSTRRIGGVARRFFDYRARGVPHGPDDGTLAPWAVVASLPFAPEIVLPALAHFDATYPDVTSHYGFKCSHNPTFESEGGAGWTAEGYYGIDQGPVVAMIENHRNGAIWSLMRRSAPIVRGLRQAGFRGGWLE